MVLPGYNNVPGGRNGTRRNRSWENRGWAPQRHAGLLTYGPAYQHAQHDDPLWNDDDDDDSDPNIDWRESVGPGSLLDVMDSSGRWLEAEVRSIHEANERAILRALPSYLRRSDACQDSRGDFEVDLSGDRVARNGRHTYRRNGNVMRGQRLEVRDPMSLAWKEGSVVEVHPHRGVIRVEWDEGSSSPTHPSSPSGYNENSLFPQEQSPMRHEWLQLDSERLRPCTGVEPSRAILPLQSWNGGRTAVVPQIRRQRSQDYSLNQEHRRAIIIASDRYAQYQRALLEKGLRVHPVEGDGNCLFRSVSHQIYGDDRYHDLVRARCMDYMEQERDYFEPYVEGDMNDFLAYINRKRQNAVWGDDPEVQALCELYACAAEIWAYDATTGAKTLRTFHEAGANDGTGGPMRLSYYGGGHYDSIIPNAGGGTGKWPPGRQPPAPGELEDRALRHSRLRCRQIAAAGGAAEESKGDDMNTNQPESGAAQSVSSAAVEAAGKKEQELLERALGISRKDFDAQERSLEAVLAASLEDLEKGEGDDVARATRASELAVVQAEMLRSVQDQSEQEQLKSVLERSAAEAEASSGAAVPMDVGGEEDDEVVKMVLAQSLEMYKAESGATEEEAVDPELAQALAMSMESTGQVSSYAQGSTPPQFDSSQIMQFDPSQWGALADDDNILMQLQASEDQELARAIQESLNQR